MLRVITDNQVMISRMFDFCKYVWLIVFFTAYLTFVIYEKNNFILLYLHTAAMVSKNFNTIELNCFGQFWWESSFFEWTLEREILKIFTES